MAKTRNRFVDLSLLFGLLLVSTLAGAQNNTEVNGELGGQAGGELIAVWNGEWIAEGTLFRIGVRVDDNIMKVTQIESMGQVWTNQDGEVDGNVVRVQVDYAGASGVIQAELIDAETAVAFAASCAPEFMVVCALSKGRQAIFRKVSD